VVLRAECKVFRAALIKKLHFSDGLAVWPKRSQSFWRDKGGESSWEAVFCDKLAELLVRSNGSALVRRQRLWWAEDLAQNKSFAEGFWVPQPGDKRAGRLLAGGALIEGGNLHLRSHILHRDAGHFHRLGW
jgi:hypothetical protein